MSKDKKKCPNMSHFGNPIYLSNTALSLPDGFPLFLLPIRKKTNTVR